MGGYPRVRLTFWRLALAAIVVVGLYATIVRFGKGLGASTGLSDEFPWGIWIGFDVLCGVALAAGGFTVAAIVYVFHLEKFRPILRPTVMTAFLGYLMAVVSLLFDLGRPYRIWHPMVMWNEHSVMFEVAWCVMLYTTVLALEFSPVILERFKLSRPLKVMHALTPPLVIVGVLLSTLHQSSLGTLFVIAPNKLHGLWYTPFLPVLFYNSAIAVGLAMTIFESSLSHRAFGVSLHKDISASLGRAIVWVLGVYLTLKLGTLAVRGNMGLIFEGSTESYLYMLEMAMGIILPIILFSMPRVQASRQGLFYSSLLVVLGVVLNRMNVSITGMQRYSGNVYFPSFLEAATTVFIIGCGFIAFGLIVRYFPIFPAERDEDDDVGFTPLYEIPEEFRVTPQPRIATPIGALILTGLAVIFAGIAWWSRSFDKAAVPREELPSQIIATGLRKLDLSGPPRLILPPDYVFPRGEISPGTVVFSHERHVKTEAEACTNCHPKPYRMASVDIATSECEYGKMSGCGYCHNGSRSFDIEGDCQLCHTGSSGRDVVTDKYQLPRRLADFRMPALDAGFGPVVFSHRFHVVGKHLACGDCHPKPYRMVRTPAPDPKMVSREAHLEWGHKCSRCHNAERAFGHIGNCGRCHSGSTPGELRAALQPIQP